ncbi:TPA: hypothetical protein DEP90_00715, partial [Patescibacteria group bacterium]|nr:hypothetical protein [Patescibacteria group bacterium]
KFPRGSASYGGTGGSDSHTHSGSRNTGTVSTLSALWYESGNFNGTTNHGHTITWSAVSSSNLPPYLTTVFAKRKTSQSTEVSSTEETENATPTAPTSLLTEGSTNPTNITDTTPEFSAIFNDPDTGDTSSDYKIEVNTLENFTGTVMWDSGKSSMTETNKGNRSPDISYAGTTLNTAVTYYWRIKFWDASDAESPWSAVANFALNQTPTAPTNLLTEGSTNPTKVADTTPEFKAQYNDANSGDTSSNYEIEVNTLENFTGTVMWDSGKVAMAAVTEGNSTADISYNGTTLSLNGTTYYWRIKLWDSQDAESPWSAVAHFIMSGEPNASDLLTDGKTNPTWLSTRTPTISAIYSDSNGDNSASYEIEVNTLENFTGTVMWDTTKQATTITSGQRSSDFTYAGTRLLDDGTTYYIRIRFWDTDDNVSDWENGTLQDTLGHFRIDGIKLEGITIN